MRGTWRGNFSATCIRACAVVLGTISVCSSATAQQQPAGGPGANSATVQLPTTNNFATATGAAPGGGANADFDTLIELIETTVSPDSWQSNGTGDGDLREFAVSGVYIDARGSLRIAHRGSQQLDRLAAVGKQRPLTAVGRPTGSNSARQSSQLRYVSLNRLQAAIASRQRDHKPLDPEMLTLAGLQRISHVAVYRETGDLVIAGPAGDWMPDGGGRIVSTDSGAPVCRLDDLLTLWRRQQDENTAAFGCSIVPRQEGLNRTQQFVAATSDQPIEPGQRREWLAGLQNALGDQDVEFYNIDPSSRTAGILLAADYHMKLIGMGLAKGVPGVKSYLATVRLDPDGSPPPMKVLRWWFSMPSSDVAASAERDLFALPENCVEVLSENEMLAARGQRVHTGVSEDLNRQFARSFTANFAALSDKYPIYVELARIFEIALALALIEAEGMTDQIDWEPALLLDGSSLRLPSVNVPRTVESIINHRVIRRRHIVAGVSGGVSVDAVRSLSITTDRTDVGTLAMVRETAVESQPAISVDGSDASAPTGEIIWWWD